MKILAHQNKINLDGLRIRVSDANRLTSVNDIPNLTVTDQFCCSDEEEIKDAHRKWLDSEQKKVLSWDCKIADEAQEKMVYVDAIQLTHQIWSERKPLEGFVRSIRITPYIDIVFGAIISSFPSVFKQIHGGDDYCLTFNQWQNPEEADLVPKLIHTELEPLLGYGRWSKFPGNEDDKWKVIGDGFAKPFWWWCTKQGKIEYDESLKKQLSIAKDKRRHWLDRTSRVEIQINLTDDTE